MMKKKPSALNEDSRMMYNKWVSGIAKRDLQPELITVADIVNRFRNRYDKSQPLPYPLNLLVDRIGDIFVKCSELRKSLSNSIFNPVIRDDKEKIQAIKSMNEKIDRIQNELFSCTEELNKLVEK
jgi:hypothetical protein